MLYIMIQIKAIREDFGFMENFIGGVFISDDIGDNSAYQDFL